MQLFQWKILISLPWEISAKLLLQKHTDMGYSSIVRKKTQINHNKKGNEENSLRQNDHEFFKSLPKAKVLTGVIFL